MTLRLPVDGSWKMAHIMGPYFNEPSSMSHHLYLLRSIFRLGFTLSRRARGFHLPVSGVLCVCVCVRVCVCVCVCDVCDARGVHLPMNG